jgi:hypothetical protein
VEGHKDNLGQGSPRQSVRKTEKTGEALDRLSRHIEPVYGCSLVGITKRHAANHVVTRRQMKMLGNQRLISSKHDLRAGVQPASLRCDHNVLDKQASVQPAVFLEPRVDSEDQPY